MGFGDTVGADTLQPDTTWFTHRHQATRERAAKEIARRETLYGDFINEGTCDAIQRDTEVRPT